MNQPQSTQPMTPVPTKQGGGGALKWLLIILVIILLGAGVYYFLVMKKGTTEEATTAPSSAITTSPTKSSGITTSPSSTSNDALMEQICKQLFPNDKYTVKNTSVGDNYCIVTKVSGDFATGAEGNVAQAGGGGPGAAWMAAKVNNQWVKVQSTQDAWDCALMRQYKVPKDLLQNDGTCFNSSTNKTEVY